MSTDQQQSLAERLGDVQVGLRGDIEFSRHLFRGEATYVARDQISFRSHRFSSEDYQLLTALDPNRPLCENFVAIVDSGLLDESQEEAFISLFCSFANKGS